MMQLHAHSADMVISSLAVRSRHSRRAWILLLVSLCVSSSALSAHVLTTVHSHCSAKSDRQPNSVKAAAIAVGAERLPSRRQGLEKGTFLVANRYLADPNFARAVVLLVDYGPEGARGLIINRPTRVSLSKVFPSVVPSSAGQDTLYLGGPVAQERMVLLLRSNQRPKDAAHVFANIFFTASEDTLRELLSDPVRDRSFHIYVGYTGWGPGQLENEVNRGDWYLVSPDSRTVFDTEPSEIWQELLRASAGLWVRRGGNARFIGDATRARGRLERPTARLDALMDYASIGP